ncbi:MAG TPA: glutamate 5-kinase [Candidatus Omnitrophota bacterium]|nr:glutamate 5-kinase [Candidatus Omnitrophota bacterium]HPD83987.1 glutamate 5-kinase [Candidatus Omnitrophota bacterium]HRZ02844.1 glutamate 5-kinase [Candidatus Omnitrophota bacterium]
MSRKFKKTIRRVVIKVGSSTIATFGLKPQEAVLNSLVDQISAVRQQGIEVILVSSGAIVLGMGQLGLTTRPKDLASLQACAAIGQSLLMRCYVDLFRKSKMECAQVLLTWDDFDKRARYNNARTTLEAILKYGAIPIINENDTIATDEIKFGDNDRLASLVAGLLGADLLLLLSDVEGLYDGNKKVFSEVKELTDEIRGVATDTGKKHMARGGMIAKLEAVKIATHANVPCVIAHGQTADVLPRIIKGEPIGTFFVEKEEKLLSKKHWISFGAKPKGTLAVDDGAKAALLKGGISLLLPGVVSWEGHFKADDVVTVVDKDGKEIARGITNYSSIDLSKTMDKKGKNEVIHCDNLVLCER